MSPQDFLEMDDGEAVCFIGKKIKDPPPEGVDLV
jgi:hypothetical protein